MLTVPTRVLTVIGRSASFLIAGIFFQTLYFKFSGTPNTVTLFSFLPHYSIFLFCFAILELISGILILFARTVRAGVLLSLGVSLFQVLLFCFGYGFKLGSYSLLVVYLLASAFAIIALFTPKRNLEE